ncbi:MAG TPA: hypothetical protein VFV79_04815 [Saprospiraceae bacterium]|nr:hypothetical protein [Saprospiraceae bacterium]
MLRLIACMSISISCLAISHGQKSTAYGISAQFYPAGIIATLDLDKFYSPKSSMMLRAGCNLIERHDFSDINDHEAGFGLGASIGYRKHFLLKKGAIIAAFNTDLWNEWINWENNLGSPEETTGQTYTLVLQPWLQTGYFTKVNKSSLQYGITAGFGREINVITDGSEVAQGWIGSVLLHFQYVLHPTRRSK